jgi:CPA2 family monovalent cation:H+ antiporter-2
VLVVVAVILVGKTLAAIGLVLAFRYPLNTALTVGASLAQIGEFSFILAGLGVSLGLLTPAAQSLIVAGALISISLNPALFQAIEPAQAWIRKRSSLARRLELRDDPLAELPRSFDQSSLTGHVLLVGYGRVGRRIADELTARSLPFVVAEQNRERVEQLRELDVPAVSGDASDAATLIQGHVARARMLVIATPDTIDVRRMVEISRRLNPSIEVVLRTHSEEEAVMLEQEKVGRVFLGEQELAQGMIRHVLDRMATTR